MVIYVILTQYIFDLVNELDHFGMGGEAPAAL